MEMPEIVWHSPDDERGNVWTILANGITLDEVRDVFADPSHIFRPDPQGEFHVVEGRASTGRYLAVAWSLVIGEPWTIEPITANVIRPPEENKHGTS